MKAITCSQCGALITEISTKSGYVDCIYCHAKIPFRNEKITEISRKKAEEEEKRQKLREKVKMLRRLEAGEHREILAEEDRTHHRWMLMQICFLLFVIILPILIYLYFNWK
jgi:uncharacterized Zn finger protein (UPF0148 family)